MDQKVLITGGISELVIQKRLEEEAKTWVYFRPSRLLFFLLRSHGSISKILEWLPETFRRFACPHQFFRPFDNHRGFLFFKRLDLKRVHESAYTSTIDYPMQCALCGTLYWHVGWQATGWTIVGPRGGYPQDFKKGYKKALGQLGLDFDQPGWGSYWNCEFPVECYKVFHSDGEAAMKSFIAKSVAS